MKLETLLATLLFIFGIVYIISGIWLYKQFRYWEALESEYLQVVKEYHQTNYQLIKTV